MKKILFLLFITIAFSSCEKDDICVDETTPRLILEFFDVSNPTIPKNVVNLKVKGVNQALDLGVFTGVSKVELPLDIAHDTAKYSLIFNSAGTAIPNEDFLEFNYTRHDVFVSRACGFKTIFTLNPSPNGVIVIDSATPGPGFWIQQDNISIITTNIETENETHIKIYF